MNTCVLMAEVITNPELRKTPDDTDVANMMVEFPGLRDEDPSTKIRVVGWGKLGVEMNDNYSTGDRIIIEGRLAMNVIEINGYKEKRAELVASHIYPVGASNPQSFAQSSVQASVMPSNVVDLKPPVSEPELAPIPEYSNNVTTTTANTTEEYDEGTLDEIPF